MSIFTYAAVTESGQRKRGTVRSQTSGEATRKLLQMGYHPFSLEPERQSRWGTRLLPQRRGVRTTDLAVVTRQMASLLHAGLPLLQTLQTLRRQCAVPRLASAIDGIAESLAQGAATLSDAMEQYPAVFNPVYRGLVRSGEQSGTLPEVMSKLAKHLSQSARLRGQVAGAFVYPAFLLLLGLIAIFVLMTFVVPRFREMFASFGQDLPWPTKALIAASGFMAGWWHLAIAAVLSATALAVLLLRRPTVRREFDRRVLRVPVVGPVLAKVEVARVASTFASLLNSGIPLLDALAITRDTARNRAFVGSFTHLIRGVGAGQTLAASMETSGMYPVLAVNLVRTGEETGELPEMLAELSVILEEDAERTVSSAVKLLEPILILTLGGVIAGIVAAVILPIFRANAMVGS
jgi:general secretion pathway protein F